MNLSNYPLWTAIITPMLNNEIDYQSFKKLLKEQEQAENGVLILGSTGEALNLTLKEKKDILKFAISCNLQIPLMCGVGGSNIEETTQWISYLETLPISSYLLVTPLYAKPGGHGQYLWFKELLDMATRPCVLYNVPSRTGISLNTQTVKWLKDHPQFAAIKEASGNLEHLKRYVELADKQIIYCGDDALLPSFAEHGAKGLISVASNLWPKQTKEYVNRCLKSSITALEIETWKKSAKSLFEASNPVPVKKMLAHLNKISSSELRSPLSDKDLTDLSKIIEANQLITQIHERLGEINDY